MSRCSSMSFEECRLDPLVKWIRKDGDTRLDLQDEGVEGAQSQTEGASSDDGGGGEEDEESDPPSPPQREADGGEIEKRFPTTLLVLAIVAVSTILFNITYRNIYLSYMLDGINGKGIAVFSSIIACELTFIYKVLVLLSGNRATKEDKIESQYHE